MGVQDEEQPSGPAPPSPTTLAHPSLQCHHCLCFHPVSILAICLKTRMSKPTATKKRIRDRSKRERERNGTFWEKCNSDLRSQK